MKPTLEQVVEYFKDAEIVECLFNGRNCDITKNIVDSIYESGSGGYWISINTHQGIGVKLWNRSIGFRRKEK
jgi:hypothetical protein